MTADARVALVTGGTRGIGAAVSRTLARAGVHVVANYRADEASARALVEESRRDGNSMSAIGADVADVAAVREMFQAVRREHRRLDILVNNAGIVHEGLFSLTKTEDFWRVMQINLGGIVNCCKCAIPLLARHRTGRIINVASIAAISGAAGLSAYAASKAAGIALSKALARELAPMGVVVNVVAPGFIDTDMLAPTMNSEVRTRRINAQAVPRMGTADEVAVVVRFLALDSPAYLTGEVIRVDGGAMVG